MNKIQLLAWFSAVQTVVSVACAATGDAASCGAVPRVGFKVESDRPSAHYRCGEETVLTVTATNGCGEAVREGAVNWTLDNFTAEGTVATGVWNFAEGNPRVFRGTLAKPDFLRLLITGDRVRDLSRWTPKQFWWGVAFEPEKIRPGGPNPSDFDAFWSNAVAKLEREVPLDPRVTRVAERSTKEYDFYRISFATTGDRRVHGFMSVPTDKAKAPFPVIFEVSSAGEGRWTMDMSHGLPDRIRVYFTVHNFEPPKTVEELGKLHREMSRKQLASYGTGYEKFGLAWSREDYYFYDKILGINRAANWIWSRDDVDRRNFGYVGGSQGGGFGLYLTGLNRRFTSAVLHVPALCDTLGYQGGHASGWPHLIEGTPDDKKAAAARNAPYFDGANFARRVTCPIRMSVGFVDTACNPASVYAAFNVCPSKDKKISDGVGLGHFGQTAVLDRVNDLWQRSLKEKPTVVEMRPGETVAGLRDRVRALPAEARAKGVKVVVPPGRYAFADSLVLDARDSGTPEAPVVWCAKDPSDKPVFVSGVELKKDAFKTVTDPALVARLDASARGKVLETDLAPYGFAMPIKPDVQWEVWGPMKVPDVFVNGRRVPLANYPGEGWCEIEEILDKGSVTGDFSVKEARARGLLGANEVVRGGTFRYREDRPSAWKSPVLIECFWAFDWRATIIWTKAIDPVAKTMTMKHHHQYGIKLGNPRPRRWRALNVFEELNAPGRYMIDPVTRKMYFYPPSEPFETVLVCGKPGGTVKFDGAHDIVFSGIDFGAAWGYGAELAGARRVTVEKALFRDQRDWAVYGTNVWDCTFRTCDVTQVGNGCFYLAGGDRRKLVPGNNLVEDCLFEDWGTLRSSCGYAIQFRGVGNKALHNEIRNANGYVVRYDQNNGLFAYNVVSNTTWGVDDAGAFYKGLNPSMRGNRLEYNYWRDIGKPGGHGSCAIYFDDGDSGDSVFGNVFENCGKFQFHYCNFGAVFSHAGCSNVVRNCLFVKCDRSLGGGPWKQEKWETAIKGRNPIKWKNYDYKFLKDVDCRSPEWRKAYPELETFLDPYPEEIRKNAAYDCVAIDCPERLHFPQKSGEVYHKGGYVAGHWHTNETFVALKGDPGFVDYAKRDYRLKPDSEVYRRLPNFKPIPFEKIGLIHRR